MKLLFVNVNIFLSGLRAQKRHGALQRLACRVGKPDNLTTARANSFLNRAAHEAGAAASARGATKSRKYGGGGQVAGGSYTPLSMESYGRLGRLAMQLLQTLAAAAGSTAARAGATVPTVDPE
jgi:hypothetical protein